jgi:hypothetical protein
MAKSKNKKPRVTNVGLYEFSTPVADYYWPAPFDKKDRFIPSSVDCVYNAEYYGAKQVITMTKSL